MSGKRALRGCLSLLAVGWVFLAVSDAEENGTLDYATGEDGNSAFGGIEGLDDEDLWRLLKEASRNGSDSPPVYDYGDYAELEEDASPASGPTDGSASEGTTLPQDLNTEESTTAVSEASSTQIDSSESTTLTDGVTTPNNFIDEDTDEASKPSTTIEVEITTLTDDSLITSESTDEAITGTTIEDYLESTTPSEVSPTVSVSTVEDLFSTTIEDNSESTTPTDYFTMTNASTDKAVNSTTEEDYLKSTTSDVSQTASDSTDEDIVSSTTIKDDLNESTTTVILTTGSASTDQDITGTTIDDNMESTTPFTITSASTDKDVFSTTMEDDFESTTSYNDLTITSDSTDKNIVDTTIEDTDDSTTPVDYSTISSGSTEDDKASTTDQLISEPSTTVKEDFESTPSTIDSTLSSITKQSSIYSPNETQVTSPSSTPINEPSTTEIPVLIETTTASKSKSISVPSSTTEVEHKSTFIPDVTTITFAPPLLKSTISEVIDDKLTTLKAMDKSFIQTTEFEPHVNASDSTEKTSTTIKTLQSSKETEGTKKSIPTSTSTTPMPIPFTTAKSIRTTQSKILITPKSAIATTSKKPGTPIPSTTEPFAVKTTLSTTSKPDTSSPMSTTPQTRKTTPKPQRKPIKKTTHQTRKPTKKPSSARTTKVSTRKPFDKTTTKPFKKVTELPPTLPTTITTTKNILTSTTTPHSEPQQKKTKFDPNRISIIDNDNADITEKPVRWPTCENQNCLSKSKNKTNLFDTKKLFMIDEVTSPNEKLNPTITTPVSPVTTIKVNKVLLDSKKKYFIPDEEEKSVDLPGIRTRVNKFDPSRVYSISEEPTTARHNVRYFRPVSRPVPAPSPNVRPIRIDIRPGEARGYEGDHRTFSIGPPAPPRAVNPVPELFCFHVRSEDRRIRLSCIHVNSTSRAASTPFLVDVRQRTDFVPQNNGFRRVYFQDRNRHALVVHQVGVPRYSLGGSVVRTQGGPPASVRLSLSGHGLQLVRRAKRAAGGSCRPDGTVYEDQGRTLAFVFDYTGSMGSELEQMREVAKEITTLMAGSKKALIRDYVLVTFNDPMVSDPFCTTSYTDFLEKLDDIRVSGGGDCPEMSLTGLQKALLVSRTDSFFFVITDASPKDAWLEGTILNIVMRKLPSIYFLLTGTCIEGNAVYQNISNASNRGQILENLDKSGVKRMIEEINTQFIRSNLVSLARTSNPNPANDPYPVNIPVDSSLTDVTVSVTGKSPKLGVISPDGNKTAGTKTTYPNIAIVNIKKPMPGIWVAYAGSSSAHTVSAVGTSETNFKVGFSVIRTNKISETSHRPLKGGENFILIEVSSPESVEEIKSIEFTTLGGEHIATIDLNRLPENNALFAGGPFIPPDSFFNMKMHGVDKTGTPITRISPSAIAPQLPELPFVTMLSRITVEAGKKLSIRCHVESLVSVLVKIYHLTSSDTIVNYSFKQTGDGFLELEKASPDDAGIYRCWAKNVAGETFKDIEVFISVKPPTITVDSQILFTKGQLVKIPCAVNSSVAFNVEWRKGVGREFFPVDLTSRVYSTSEGLIIENSQEADEGWYQCLATNSGGGGSGVTYLKMGHWPSIEISQNQFFQKNLNVTVTCIARGGIPPADISWLKNEQKFPLEDTSRIIVNNSPEYSEIHILNASEEDQGNYTCIASNFVGKVTEDVTLTYIEIPKVTILQSSYNILAGEDILLICEATGIPAPIVEWTKNDIPINRVSFPDIKILSDNGLLKRPSTLNDSGIYTCFAHNDFGSDQASLRVSVSGVLPQINEAPEDITLDIGESGRLSCQATGHPEPNIFWERSGDKAIRASQIGTSLEFINVSLADGGEYWCIAENSLGSDKAVGHVVITGGVKPILNKVKDIETIKVLVGDKAELTCSVIGGNPSPRIEWFKDGIKLSGHLVNGIQLDNGSYFISAVNPTDTGLFECMAINELGSDLKKIELKLYEPPKISNASTNVVWATAGSSAKLKCIVTGDPSPNVTWKRYSHSRYVGMRGAKLEETNDLYFEEVSEEDTGRYICKAENIAGIARRPFTLHVMVPPKILPWPVEMFVEIGNIVTLECRVRAIPRPSILWMKDNRTLPRSKYYGQFARFYANEYDSGTYSCTAENTAGKDRVETNLIVLVPPKIIERPSTLKVISGNEAILPCEASGNPQPIITWQWNGELIKKEFGRNSGALHLNNVTEADAGTYICTAQNKAGTNKKKMELIVLTPPRILPWTVPLKVVIGEFVNVTCQYFSNPEAKISWYKDRVPLPPSYIGDKGRLEFFAKPYDKGVFTCEAINEAGSDSKDFLLVILDPPTFAQNLPYTFDVLKGSDINIPCVAFGDPKPVMGWNRTDIILSSTTKRTVNSETGDLTILNASIEDEGYYNCTASNRAGEIWRTVEVNVLELPTAKVSVPYDLVKEGDEVEFTCITTGKPTPKILWMKNGKILSTEDTKYLRILAYYKDQGNYTCAVKNSAGEDYSTVQLNVAVIPKIHGPLEEIRTVLEGEDIILNCSSEGIPSPSVLWFSNGTLLEKYSIYSEIVNNTLLKMPAISRERDGSYTCEAQNFAGAVKKQFKLFVHAKPSITDEFETILTITEGKDLTLPCIAQGIPEPKITWMKNGTYITKASSVTTSPFIQNNILFIYNANNSSAGVYTCSAANVEGVASKNYTITVQAIEIPKKPGIEYVEVNEFKDGTLNCNATPGSEIVWLKDNRPVERMPFERADDVRVLTINDGNSLKFTEAFHEDSGVYTCQAYHPEGNSTKLFSVNVLVAPYFKDFQPETDFTVRENASLTLDCPIIGNPPPVVNWRLALSNVPVNQFTTPGVYPYGDQGMSLLFKSAQPNHTGIYLCSAVNKMGKEARTFNVKVVGPPKRSGPELTQHNVVSGDKVELNCSVDGSPSPVYKWSLLPTLGEETLLKYVSQKIQIGYAQVEDDGLYVCSASNPYGNITKQFNVSVYDVPRIKRDTNDKIYLAEGEDLYLNCLSEGRKPFTVKWFFNQEELNRSDHISIQVSLSSNLIKYSYRVPNVTKLSQGVYRCLLTNIAGSDQTDFDVKVVAPPKSIKPAEKEILQVNIGSPVYLKCPIDSENDFKIQWKKNGNLLEEFENRSLDIPFTTVDDEGTYTCVGSNIAGWLAYKFELNVLAVPRLTAKDDKTNLSIPLGESLILNCSVFGNPKPGILWTKNLEPITETLFPQISLLDDDQILKIDDVDATDGGKYSCFPSNIAGSTEKHFEVTVLELPSMKVNGTPGEKNVTSEIFKRVVLRCPLTGSPEPEIVWYKDSEEIDASDKEYRVSLNGKVLIINHADMKTAGVFKCLGKHDIGDTSFIFHLHINIPMQWGQWSKWTECNTTCGGGFQIRTRECLGDRNEILSEYVHLHNKSCIGPNLETQICNEHICPIDGGWGNWTEWGSCSSSCGRGWKRRSRRCNEPPPAYGGADCTGETYQDIECDEIPCPINGAWGEWSDWSECSATCGPSIKMRTRRCNNPAPAHGGLPCSGNSRDITLCRQRDCPTDLSGWSSWSRWSPCSATCGIGRQSRTRTCLLQSEERKCIGTGRQNRLCRNSKPCPRRRYPRHVEINIHGEINNKTVEETVEADIISKNETREISFSKEISPNETFSYLPFVAGPVSWYTAQEDEKGKNGLSLTNGTFHENSTYIFSTGEQMEMFSDAQMEDSDDSLKLNVKIKGNTPPMPVATIVINPYSEDILQTDPNKITSSSTVNIDADGQVIPVSVKKTVKFPGNRVSKIFPVETLSAKGSRSRYNYNTNQLEFRASPTVISSKFNRGNCPEGFKYNMETKECTDINECRRRGLNTCLPSQICINTLGSFICECRQGFRVTSQIFGCKDINECFEGLHQCSHRCINTRGSYQCLCPKHLILAEDMHNCVEDSEDYYTDAGDSLDYLLYSSSVTPQSYFSSRTGKALNDYETPEYQAFQSNPEIHQQDQSTDDLLSSGSLLTQDLACLTGFRTGKNGCEDVNECFENENSCTKEQLCMNTPGSFVCIEAPCPDHFVLSAETRSCVLLCLEEEGECTDGAILSESLQILTVPVYKGNYTFYPYTDILEMTSYDNNDLPLSGSIYEIVQNEAGLPVNIRTEKMIGVLFAAKYFEVLKEERLVLMSSKYDTDGSKLHSTMFVVLIYNIKSPLI